MSAAILAVGRDYTAHRRGSCLTFAVATVGPVPLFLLTAKASNLFQITQVSLADGNRVERWMIRAGLLWLVVHLPVHRLGVSHRSVIRTDPHALNGNMGRNAMMSFTMEVTVTGFAVGARLLAPAGLHTPHGCAVGVAVKGGDAEVVFEKATGQATLSVAPTSSEVTFRYSQSQNPGRYPEAMFRPTQSRFTRAADALLAEALALAGTGDQLSRARRIACGVAERFSYGHPEVRFSDGRDEVPAIGCGLTEGSCVDINTYFMAALRAAGIEAGYVTGYFFPAEKRNWCLDGHCWVVTRIGGVTQEWDIAHHLKLGVRDIHPALNPKPGFRVAGSHSMGLNFPALGVADLKALIEPMSVADGRCTYLDGNRIRLFHPALAA